MAGDEALLMFGDSSGNPSRARGGFVDSPYYIVCTITMGAGEAYRINDAILDIKRRYFSRVDPVRIEFHGSAMRKKLHLHTGNRKRADKMFSDILDKLVDIIKDSDVVINMVIMDKGIPIETAEGTSVLGKSWAHAADMFRQNILHSKLDTVGIAILDRYDDASNRMVSRYVAQSLRQLGSLVQNTCNRAIPHPIFVDAKSSNIVQLVDIVTYIVAKHIMDGDDREFARWYRQLLPRTGRIINLTVSGE